MPPLDVEEILRDGVRVATNVASSNDRLSREHSRSVGPPEPLLGPPAGDFLSDWHGGLPRDLGEVHYLAIPHEGSGQ